MMRIAEADSTSTKMHLKGPGLSDRTNSATAQLTSLKRRSRQAVHAAIENELR